MRAALAGDRSRCDLAPLSSPEHIWTNNPTAPEQSLAPECSPGRIQQSSAHTGPAEGGEGWQQGQGRAALLQCSPSGINPSDGGKFWSWSQAQPSTGAKALGGPPRAWPCLPLSCKTPAKALSLHCLNKCNQSPPCPTGNPAAFRGKKKRHKICLQREAGIAGIPPKDMVPKPPGTAHLPRH